MKCSKSWLSRPINCSLVAGRIWMPQPGWCSKIGRRGRYGQRRVNMVQEDPTPCPRLDVASLYKHEFWWSHYGFLPRYHDVLHLTSKDPVLDYGISLFTKGFAHDIDSNYKAQRFDKTFEQLVQQEKILFSKQFEPQPVESRG